MATAIRIVRTDSDDLEEETLDQTPGLVPVFEIVPKPLNVKPGETIKLSCKVSAEDDPEVTWYKEEQPIKTKKSEPRISVDWEVATDLYILSITDAVENDSGLYTAKAENKYGETSKTVRVQVMDTSLGEPPQIKKFPKPAIVSHGQTISISCEISGHPSPEVKWFKDGEPAVDQIDSRRLILHADDAVNFYKLEVKDATEVDSGEYTITAINSYGKIFHAVNVAVQEEPRKRVPQVEEVPPEFKVKPRPVAVPEFEPIRVTVSIIGQPEPTVTWFKGGKLLKPTSQVQISSEDGTHSMYIPRCTLLDAGEYTITANNIAGGSFCTVSVHVEAASESEASTSTDYEMGTSTDQDLVIIEKLSPQILAEMDKIRSGDEDAMLFREFLLRQNFVDPLRGIELTEGEVVEVLDTEKGEEWLVRKQNDRRKICYVPVRVLQGKGEAELSQILQVKDSLQQALPDTLAPDMPDLGAHGPKAPSPARQRGKLSRSPSKRSTDADSSGDEAIEMLSEVLAVYVAIADYNPPENDRECLKLKEGQFVDVLDSNNPSRWLVRTKPTKLHPSKQGWVSPAFLEQKKGIGQLDRRSTREVFREDIIQITNKSQEALIKRRYALTELLETEREYLIDLGHVMDRYYSQFDRVDLPDELVGKKEIIFGTFEGIYKFHNEKFLSALMQCTGNPNTVGVTFLNFTDDFQLYVDYYLDRDEAVDLLNLPMPKKFINWIRKQVKQKSTESEESKEYEKEQGESRLSLIDCLERPTERISRYVALLKDFIRYTSRAGEDCEDLEGAIQMLNDLPRQACDWVCVKNIEGRTEEAQDLGCILRHDDLWIVDEDSPGRARDRHAFLFDNKLLLTKKRRPESPDESFTYLLKNIIHLQDIQINEILPDDRCFEIWYAEPTSEKMVIQCKNAYARQAWCGDIRTAMRALGVEDTDIPVEDTESKKPAPPVPPKPKKKPSEVEQPSFEDIMKSVQDTDTESRATLEYVTADSYESDLSSYFSAQEFEDGTSRPGFRRKLRPVMVTEGEPVRLEAEIAGIPTPTVTWFYNGDPITDTENFKFETGDNKCALVIEHATLSMAGKFGIRIENKNGASESKANLIVEKKVGVPPEFKKQLKAQNVKEGKSLTMEIEVSGDPEPKICWFKDEESIEDTTVVRKEGGNYLSLMVVDCVPLSMSGIYTVRASNEFGVAECSATLNVEKVGQAPAFKLALMSADVSEGKPCRLEAEISGSPMPVVTWYKDGEQIMDTSLYKFEAGDGRSALVIDNADIKMAGVYKVKAENDFGIAECSATLIVKKGGTSPEFVQPLQPMSVMEGEECQLEVEVSGNPYPALTWYKDKTPITDSSVYKFLTGNNKSVLVIEAAALDMAGNYAVKAENDFGGAECSATVSVQKAGSAPEFKARPESLSMKEGEPCQIEIELTGDPVPVVTWFKDNQPILDTSVFKFMSGDNKCVLVIDKCSVDMDGTFKVKAVNDFGTAECTINLTVEKAVKAPEFQTSLEPVTVTEGEPVRLEVKVTGEPGPTVTWYRENKKIKSGKKCQITVEGDLSVLLIDKAEMTMAGTYKAEATNQAGTVECTTKVKVEKGGEPPEFQKSLSDLTVKEGEPIDLEVMVVGHPNPKITWFRGDKRLKMNKINQITTEGGSSKLRIDHSELDMAGTYSVEAANDRGEAECSCVVKVDKAGEAPTFKSQLEPVTVIEGEELRLEVKTAGVPGPEVTWYRNKKKIKGGKKCKVTTEDGVSYIVMKNASLDMAGTYKVVLSNEFGSVESSTEVTVEKAEQVPEFKSKLKPVKVKEGEGCQLEVEVQGEPAPTVTWYKDNQPITDTSVYKFLAGDNKSALVIDKASLDMGGTYTVKAVNSAGMVECSETVAIQKAALPPEFKIKLKPVIIKEGEPCQFEVEVQGEPAPAVTWYKDNQPITDTSVYKFLAGDNKSALVIDKASLDMGGDYAVKATNEAGSTECQSKLVVKKDTKPPEFTIKLKPISIKEGDPGQFEVKVKGKPAPTVTWYKDNQPITDTSVYKFLAGDNKSALVIDKASLDMGGIYTVKATNEAGSAKCSSTFEVKEGSQKPKLVKGLEPQTVEEGQTLTLQCKVKGKPTPAASWYKGAKPLSSDGRITISAEKSVHKLEVKNVKTTDAGEYKIRAKNKVGSVLSKAVVKIMEPEVTEESEEDFSEEEESISQQKQTEPKPEPAKPAADDQSEEREKKKKDKGKKEVKDKSEKIQPEKNSKTHDVDTEKKDVKGKKKTENEDDAKKKSSEKKKKEKSEAQKISETPEEEPEKKEVKEKKKPKTEEDEPEKKTSKKKKKATAETEEMPETSEEEPEKKGTKGKKKPSETEENPKKKTGDKKKKTVKSEAKETVDEGDDPLKKKSKSKEQPKDDTDSGKKSKGVKSEEVKKGKHLDKQDDEEKVGDSGEKSEEPDEDKGKVTDVDKKEKDAKNLDEKGKRKSALKSPDTADPGQQEGDFKGKGEKNDQPPMIMGIKTKIYDEDKDTDKKDSVDKGALKAPGDSNMKKASSLKSPSDSSKDAFNTSGRKGKRKSVTLLEPTKIISKLKHQSVSEGLDVKLECRISCSTEPQIIWFHNDQPINPARAHKAVYDGEACTLSLPDVHESDSGTYTCRIISATTITETSSEVVVIPELKSKAVGHIRPAILDAFEDAEVRKRKEAKFSCNITGEPPPKVKWYSNGLPLIETGRISILHEGQTHTLVIRDVFGHDTGEILVQAKNEAGEVTHKAHLEVIEEKLPAYAMEDVGWAPKITKKLMDTEVLVGQKATFSVRAIGEPYPRVTWYRMKDGAIIHNEGRYTVDCHRRNVYNMLIDKVNMEDAGEYKCRLQNSAGKVSCIASLIVDAPKEDKPEEGSERSEVKKLPQTTRMEKPRIKRQSDGSLLLLWQPPPLQADSGYSSISYIVEEKDMVGGEWHPLKTGIKLPSLKISGININKDYMFRVRAKMNSSIGEPSLAVSYLAEDILARNEVKKPKEVEKDQDRFKSKLPPRTSYEKPTLYDVTDNTVSLRWTPAEIPSYGVQTDIVYKVEYRCPPSREWLPLVTDLKDSYYVFSNYNPEKEYVFRVRAVNKFGEGDPSLAVTILPQKADLKIQEKKEDRGKREKQRKEREADENLKRQSTEDQRPKVAPRAVWDRPDLTLVTDNSVVLKWKPSSIPSYAKQTSIKYVVEKREPPSHEWTVLAKDLDQSTFEAKDLNRQKDYYFRVKAMNEYGTSEPSMAGLLRRLEVPRRRTSGSRDDLKDHKVPWFLGIKPEFVGAMDDTQYGVAGETMKITTHIRGYPLPKVMWFHNEEKVELEGRYTSTLSPSGELILEIKKFQDTDKGHYKVYVENEAGAATQLIQVDLADPPTFLEPMRDLVVYLHKSGHLRCLVHGIPYPDVRFKHDWRPIANSHHMHVRRDGEEEWTLDFNGAIHLDEGLYECVAENIAGTVYCSAKVKVTEESYVQRDIKFNRVPLEDHFHVVDEISRGSYGIVRRVIDKNMGTQYAAKFLLFGDEETRKELEKELEMMSLLNHPNIVRVADGYQDKRRLIIVMDLVPGGELFQRIVHDGSLTESQAAYYLRQVIRALQHMHSKHVVYLDLKPENLLLVDSAADEIKLIDFGFARRYNPQAELKVKYGTPEFVAPEVLLDQPVTPAADLWALGAVTYLLLGGKSPFHADTERETLKNVKAGTWKFHPDGFTNTSPEARDFITKLLNQDPKKRLTASEALHHPFIQLADHQGIGEKISVEGLRAYNFRRKWQRGISAVRTVVRPRPLSSYMLEAPEVSEEQLPDQLPVDGTLPQGAAGMMEVMGPPSIGSVGSTVGSASEWAKEYEDEDTWYEWSRDKKPRRDLRDFKDEEEVDTRSGKSPKTPRRSVRQLKCYVGSVGREEGYPPIFKVKVRDQAYNVGENCTLRVHVIGNPPPSVSWYRNDELLTDGYEGYGRVRTSQTSDGRFSLTILSTLPNDFGIFKCVARNKHGKVTCRARMLQGGPPARPGRPHVTKISDKEVFTIWEEPETDGNSFITAYRVDWRKENAERWTIATYCIDECALVEGLEPETTYRFRVSAINKFGNSPYSWGSVQIKTKPRGCPPIDVDETTKKILLRSRQATRQPSPDRQDYDVMDDQEAETEKLLAMKETDDPFFDREVMLQESTNPREFFHFQSEIWRGRYSVVLDAVGKQDRATRVAKILPYNTKSPEQSLREYEMLKGVRQEHVVRLYEAFVHDGHVILILEKLFGENVARSLSLKNKYNEHQVSCIIKQVIDALQFLHHRGIVHLNLQPDNVIMTSRRRCDVKLIDFGRARVISSSDGVKVPLEGTLEYNAPEKIAGELVGVAADVWGVGVLVFTLLSGTSPFRAECDEDTSSNILAVRYDAHELFHNITRYALKFIYQTLRRETGDRLTTEECLDHRWITPNHQLVKQRKAAIFTTDKLRKFEEDYIQRRMSGAVTQEGLVQTFGASSV